MLPLAGSWVFTAIAVPDAGANVGADAVCMSLLLARTTFCANVCEGLGVEVFKANG